jgi:DNA-binding NtrC family response regulator
MSLFNATERRFVEALARLAHCNPFTSERIECERAALGDAFDPHQADWNVRFQGESDHPNLARLLSRSESVLEQARKRIARHPGELSEQDVALYEDLLLMTLYHRHRGSLDELIREGASGASGNRAAKVYKNLAADAERYVTFGDRRIPMAEGIPHLFAGFFQIRRAFDNIFRLIQGVSQPAVRLRAVVWESIFTHDMRRYRRALYSRMADFTTLVTGPSGTGKELVAQAIGLSRYIPFDANQGRFCEDFAGSFYPVNLSALSPTLIESELFGHKRGSFTGAIADRQGWLEVCPQLGTVFLDEIGEVDIAIQVKLLRVLQSREFVPLGDTSPKKFKGKIIAATNRNLADEMHHGRFRHDFYYRLCSDIVTVPTLKERIADNAEELQHLVRHLAQRAVGGEAEILANEVVDWIDCHLGQDYPWPGNVRELEQCLRNILIRRAYAPTQPVPSGPMADLHDDLLGAIVEGRLTADELLRRYCTLVFAATGSYEATARKLKLDRRTVRAKVDPVAIDRFKMEKPSVGPRALIDRPSNPETADVPVP